MQAINVLAGYWPPCPHPTLFPGGQGSVAPMYDVPAGIFTFYYLELALEAKLQRKVILMSGTGVQERGARGNNGPLGLL